MRLKYQSGIYRIKNLINNNFYIGQAVNLYTRRYQHWYDLKNDKHGNSHLQNAYNKYGKENFIFEIILYCEPKELTYYEQKLVDLLNPNYNMCKICVNSVFGIIRSEKTKEKISKSGSGKHNKGKPMSIKQKMAMQEGKQLAEEERQNGYIDYDEIERQIEDEKILSPLEFIKKYKVKRQHWISKMSFRYEVREGLNELEAKNKAIKESYLYYNS